MDFTSGTVEFGFKNEGTKSLFEAGPRPTLLMAGIGSGKTTILTMKMMYLLDKYPNSRGAIIRRTARDLRKTVVQEFLRWSPPGMLDGKNTNEGIFTLLNRSILYFIHLDDPGSLDALKSLPLNFGGIDQAEEINAAAWDGLDERVGRWDAAQMLGGWPDDWSHKTKNGRPIPPPYFFANAYSPGYDHFLYNRFHEHGNEYNKYRELGYQYFTASSRDNDALTAAYVAKLIARGKDYVDRYVDAISWGANEGTIFELSDDSIIDPDVNPDLINKILRSMKLHRCMDHGESNPTVVLWYGTDYDGNLWFYREYVAISPLISLHRQNVYRLSLTDGGGMSAPTYYSNIGDPSILSLTRGRNVNSGPRWSVADEWSSSEWAPKETAVRWTGGENGEEVTRTRLHEYFNLDPNHTHPITGKRGAPHVYFIKKTKRYPNGMDVTIREIRSQRRVQIGTKPDGSPMFNEERAGTNVTGRDDAYDASKYGICSHPALGAALSLPSLPVGQMYVRDFDEAEKKQRTRLRREEYAAGPGSIRNVEGFY